MRQTTCSKLSIKILKKTFPQQLYKSYYCMGGTKQYLLISEAVGAHSVELTNIW